MVNWALDKPDTVVKLMSNSDTVLSSNPMKAKATLLKLNVILKFFQVEERKCFLIAIASNIVMNLIKMNWCLQQSSILVITIGVRQINSTSTETHKHTYTTQKKYAQFRIYSYLIYPSAISSIYFH